MNKNITDLDTSTMFAAASVQAQPGRLYLVSTGCGDPDNMTVRAQRIIKSADVVLTMSGEAEPFGDLLAGKELHAAGHALFGFDKKWDNAQPHGDAAAGSDADVLACEKLGKGMPVMFCRGSGSLEEKRERIRAVVRHAVAEGKTVAILDNGDPAVFGPQMGYIREFADLAPVVVPGISSFNAANAALRRNVVGGAEARSIALTTLLNPCGDPDLLDAVVRADPADALAFFTMRTEFAGTVAKLKAHYPGPTPIAIVLHAGYADKERVVEGTLDDIESKVGTETLPFAHLIYLGSFLKAGR